MDKINVTSKRSSVPNWAKSPEAGTAEEVTNEALSGEPKITPNQRGFLLDLIAKKQVKPDQEGKIDLIMKCLRISEDPEEYGMSKSKASELITWFLKQDDKPKERFEDGSTMMGFMKQRFEMEVPSGRYAVDNDQGELRFYNVWVSRDKMRLNVYVAHGPEDSNLKYQQTVMGVLRKIKDAGIREAAIRYGMEIGSCSNCGRRLTNRISRELGIGPICGGRMFGEADWKDEVKTKRQEIMLRGEDPDEELDD